MTVFLSCLVSFFALSGLGWRLCEPEDNLEDVHCVCRGIRQKCERATVVSKHCFSPPIFQESAEASTAEPPSLTARALTTLPLMTTTTTTLSLSLTTTTTMTMMTTPTAESRLTPSVTAQTGTTLPLTTTTTTTALSLPSITTTTRTMTPTTTTATTTMTTAATVEYASRTTATPRPATALTSPLTRATLLWSTLTVITQPTEATPTDLTTTTTTKADMNESLSISTDKAPTAASEVEFLSSNSSVGPDRSSTTDSSHRTSLQEASATDRSFQEKAPRWIKQLIVNLGIIGVLLGSSLIGLAVLLAIWKHQKRRRNQQLWKACMMELPEWENRGAGFLSRQVFRNSIGGIPNHNYQE